jgi:hypothetical protein
MAKVMEKHRRVIIAVPVSIDTVWQASTACPTKVNEFYSTYTVGTVGPVTGLLTPPIRRVTGSASPFKCVPGMRQLIW